MSRAGVRPDIAERVLGHAFRGVERVYDRHHYDEQKAAALSAGEGRSLPHSIPLDATGLPMAIWF